MVHLEEVQLDTIPSPSPLSSSFLLYYRGNTKSVSCNYWYRLLDRLGQRPGEPSVHRGRSGSAGPTIDFDAGAERKWTGCGWERGERIQTKTLGAHFGNPATLSLASSSDIRVETRAARKTPTRLVNNINTLLILAFMGNSILILVVKYDKLTDK